MNPTNNTGSFGAAIGGLSPELAAAMQSRQGGGGATSSQVSLSAPTLNPQSQPAQPPSASVPSLGGLAPQATSGLPTPSTMGQSSTGLPFDSAEAKIIIQTLGNRLKSISRIQGA